MAVQRRCTSVLPACVPEKLSVLLQALQNNDSLKRYCLSAISFFIVRIVRKACVILFETCIIREACGISFEQAFHEKHILFRVSELIVINMSWIKN